MSTAARHDLPLAVATEPIRGVKVVEVAGAPSAPRLHPAGRYWREPVEHREVAVAACRRGRRHEAPAVACSCGFHAVADGAALRRTMCVHHDHAVAEVELSGRVVEHDDGWRGARQRVLGLCFSDRCSGCGSDSTAIVAGRRWRSACASCADRARRRGLVVLRVPDATAALAVDVRFGPVPVEDRASWRHWRVRSVVALAAAVACAAVLALVVDAPALVLFGAGAAVLASGGTCAAVCTARGSRRAPTWLSVQCWAVTVLAALMTVTAVWRR